jgi:adenylate cyclase
MAETRKLAAILAADVAGYSKLAGADEERTLARLRALRSDLFDPTIALHHGRVVKRTGDGVLIEFRSVVDAVRCAIEVLDGMAERNAGLSPERRIEFRVGIHLGDVVEESDGDLMGDGVNIAARLEGIAKPGSIYLSEDAYRQVKSRLDLAVSDLGATQLKNIAEPVRVYSLEVGKPAPGKPTKSTAPAAWLRTISPRWAGAALVALVAIGVVAWQVVERLSPPSREGGSVSLEAQRRGPTIAALPFDNLSGDPSQDFFSDGISEQIITVLSRFDNLRVLARNTTSTYKKKAIDVQELGRQLNAQYVIEGSFRRVADQISVTAQLIDARSGTHVWAQTFERPTASTNLLAIQDDVAQRIGAAVGAKWTGAVATAELERTRNKPASELSSYECALTASRTTQEPSIELMQRARTCLDATVKRDPTYADAWNELVHALVNQRLWGTGLPSPEAQDIDKRSYLVVRVMEAANRSVELAPQSASAHWSLFLAYWLMCQPERMRVEAETILAINPNDAAALGGVGIGLIYAGEPDYGRQFVEKAISLAGPAAPKEWWGGLADYYYTKGEYAKALELFRNAYIESWWVDHMRLIALLPHLGRVEEARAEIPSASALTTGGEWPRRSGSRASGRKRTRTGRHRAVPQLDSSDSQVLKRDTT